MAYWLTPNYHEHCGFLDKSNSTQFSMRSQYTSPSTGKINGLLRRSLDIALLDTGALVGVHVLDFIPRLVI